MEPTIKQKLDNLIGNTYTYNGKTVTITKYKEVGGTNTVVFMPEPKNLYNTELEFFLSQLVLTTPKKEFTPQRIEPNPTPEHPTQIVQLDQTYRTENIKQALDAMLAKVMADATAIPQAKAVCEIANSYIGIQKNEIQMYNIINRKK